MIRTLIIVLFFISWAVSAQTPTRARADQLLFRLKKLNQEMELVYSDPSYRRLKELREKVNKFMRDSGRDGYNYANTPWGRTFVAHTQKLEAFWKIRNGLNSCSRMNDQDRASVLQFAMNEDPCSFLSSQPKSMTGLHALRESWREVASQLKSDPVDSLNQKLLGEAAFVSARTIWQLEREASSFHSQSDGVRINAVCDVVDCEKLGVRGKLNQELSNLRRLHNQNRNRLTAEQKAQSLNEQIAHLNAKLERVEVPVNPGWFNNFLWDSSDPEHDELSQSQFSEYHRLYLETVGRGVGTLLLTPNMIKKVGELRAINEPNENSNSNLNSTSYSYIPHGFITANDLRISVEEAKSEVSEQLKKLQEEFNNAASPQDKRELLKKMLVTYPAAAARVLLDNPETMELVCEAYAEAHGDQIKSKTNRELVIYGGLIVGGALTAIAVAPFAAGAAAAVLAKTGLAAGATALAASTTATATSSTVAIAALTVGIAETAYATNDAMVLSEQMTDTRRALISRATSARELEELTELSHRYDESVRSAILGGVFSAVDVGALAHMGRLMRGERGSEVVQNLPATLTDVTKWKAEPTMSEILSIGAKNDEEMGAIVAALSEVGTRDRAEFMRRMQTLRRTPGGEQEVAAILQGMKICE